jgi:Short C-terminal domain
MSTRTAVFRVIGFAGAASIATGIHAFIRGADCATATVPCQVDVGRSTGLLLGGILAGMIGTFGSGFAVFAAMFAGVGLGAVLAGLQSSGFGHGFGLLFGGIFLATSLIPIGLVLLGRAAGHRTARLLATGTRGMATVLDIQDTGVTINDNPRLRLHLQVRPADDTPPFETTIALTVSRIDIPRRGDQRPVIFDPADHSSLRWDLPGLPVPASGPPPAYGTPPEYGAQAPTVAISPAPAFGTPDGSAPVLDELERLTSLHAANALTDEEFARLKARLLGDQTCGPAVI